MSTKYRPVNVFDKVQRVEKIAKRIFWIWAIFIAVYVLYRIGVDLYTGIKNQELIFTLKYFVSKIIEEIIRTVYLTFPFFILIFSIFTFVSSYTIFSSRNYKNVFIFLFIVFLAFFIDTIYGSFLTMESINLSSTNSFLIMLSITGATCIVIYLLQRKIVLEGEDTIEISEKDNIDILLNEHIKTDEKLSNEERNQRELAKKSRRKLGIVISGMLATFIAMIFLLHIEKYEFITSGFILGMLLSGLIIQGEKLALGLLYFVDPEEAENIFRTYSLMRAQKQMQIKIQSAKDVTDIITELSRDEELRQLMAIKMALINQMKKARNKRIDDLIQKIDAGQLTFEELVDKIKEIDEDLPLLINAQLPAGHPKIQMLDDGTSNYTIDEKIKKLIGLDEYEIEGAIKKDLISPSQAFLWKKTNMKKVKISLSEFENGQFDEYNPNICIPNSLKQFLESNDYILKSLAKLFTEASIDKNKTIVSTSLKGVSNLDVLDFSTAVNNYSAIVKKGTDDKMLLILGIFQRPISHEVP